MAEKFFTLAKNVAEAGFIYFTFTSLHLPHSLNQRLGNDLRH